MNEKKNPRNLVELLSRLQQEKVPEEQYKIHIDYFLEMQTRKKGIPWKGQFELTPLCNLDCKMCYVHLQKGQLKNQSLLEPELWRELMEQAVSAGMRKAVLTGGECLLYPGFEELYLYLQSKGVEVQVYTNGILLTEERVLFFKKNMPARIQVSVYGSCEDAYEKVTGHREYERVRKNIELARQVGLPLQVAVTPSVYMGKDARNIVRYMSENRIPYQINNTIFAPRNDTGRGQEKIDTTPDEYIELFKLQAQLSGAELCRRDEKMLPDVPEDSGEKKGIRCAAGMNSFHIDWKGTMTGCDMLNSVKAEPLKKGFDHSWKLIHKAALEYPAATKCENCSYNSVCVSCPAIHQQLGEKPGHCSLMVCERTRRFAAEGLISL
ncbi:radical SAM protein [Blautia sp. MSJ-9]|uniref:radical SAM protein n=1 Tax=Blautia sp. MSJ-9 TaxID=2841511 RepID=UPI001C10F409|nr:radical SAM protein [Blautia sp. MSJ-9]MBU5681122.1 radical SAM protein [Blautia sp. MSJ-9]